MDVPQMFALVKSHVGVADGQGAMWVRPGGLATAPALAKTPANREHAFHRRMAAVHRQAIASMA
jgi:hypothetical protein